jgi:hypothetical protein
LGGAKHAARRGFSIQFANWLGGGNMIEEQPVVFVIDDDPSIRAALSHLFRSLAINSNVRLDAGISSGQAS